MSAPSGRRPGWIAFGALLIGLSGLGGAYLLSIVTDTIAVIVAARDLAPGEVIGPADLRVVEMGRTTDLRAIEASQQSLVVGLAARSAIPHGTVLNTDLFVARDDLLRPGEVVVGAAFVAGSVPASRLVPGDVVGLLRVASEREQLAPSPAGAGGAGLIGSAAVWEVQGEVSSESSSQQLLVSLLVDRSVQVEVVQAASDGLLRLVLTGSSR